MILHFYGADPDFTCRSRRVQRAWPRNGLRAALFDAPAPASLPTQPTAPTRAAAWKDSGSPDRGAAVTALPGLHMNDERRGNRIHADSSKR
jgi:hypothetical protein